MAAGILPYILIFLFVPLFCEGAFEYFYFVQTWPASYCDSPTLGNRQCGRLPPSNFTIHGLWPANFSNAVVANCPGAAGFSYFQRPSFKESMEKNWPDLMRPYSGGRYQIFWGKQWQKHGSCSREKYIQDDYFHLALNLKARYNLLEMLSNDRLHPGSDMLMSQVETAVGKYINGKKPELLCDTNRAGDRLQLKEIRICLNPDATEPIDCPTRLNSCLRIVQNYRRGEFHLPAPPRSKNIRKPQN